MDTVNGGYFLTAAQSHDIPVRKKQGLDNALPSANSMMVETLLRLFHITGENEYHQQAARIVQAFAGELAQYPHGFTMMLSMLQSVLASSREIVIVGEGKTAEDMIKTVNKHYLPSTLLLHKTAGNAHQLHTIAPYTREQTNSNPASPVAYVCSDFSCNKPVSSPEELEALLGR
jgi:hypothetical protein